MRPSKATRYEQIPIAVVRKIAKLDLHLKSQPAALPKPDKPTRKTGGAK